MRQRQRGVWRRAVFALLLGVWLALLPQAASAEKTDWKDSSYDFSRVKRVLVYDVDLSVPDFSSNLKAHKYQSDFPQYAKKMGCEILTEEQARRRISLAIGVDLDGLANTDPARANQLFAENLSTVADAWVKSRVLKWENSYYIKRRTRSGSSSALTAAIATATGTGSTTITTSRCPLPIRRAAWTFPRSICPSRCTTPRRAR